MFQRKTQVIMMAYFIIVQIRFGKPSQLQRLWVILHMTQLIQVHTLQEAV